MNNEYISRAASVLAKVGLTKIKKLPTVQEASKSLQADYQKLKVIEDDFERNRIRLLDFLRNRK